MELAVQHSSEEGAFSSLTPTKVVTTAPASKDAQKPFSWTDEENDEGLSERLAPLGQASEGEDEVYYEGKWDW